MCECVCVCVCVSVFFNLLFKKDILCSVLTNKIQRLKRFIQKDKIYFLRINCINNLCLISKEIKEKGRPKDILVLYRHAIRRMCEYNYSSELSSLWH